METPFDRIVFTSPNVIEIDRLGETTPVSFSTFGRGMPDVLWEQMTLPLRAAGASALFCPAYTGPLLYKGKMVVANHGIYEGLPGEFSLLERLRATPLNRGAAARADRLIANSESTRNDLARHFRIPESRIDIVYPAAHDLFFEEHDPASVAAEVASVLGEKAPYVIFVGKLAKRRNVPNLVKAFALVRERQALPHHLLIVGPNTTGIDVDQLACEAGVAEVVHYIPYLEQRPLARLYAGADLYVLPSSHEGISQTMFEAMASGAPVLTVEHATVREGGADAVHATPTASVEDLGSAMSELLTDPSRLQRLSRAGKERASRFSWRETARRTIEILDRIALPEDRRELKLA